MIFLPESKIWGPLLLTCSNGIIAKYKLVYNKLRTIGRLEIILFQQGFLVMTGQNLYKILDTLGKRGS